MSSSLFSTDIQEIAQTLSSDADAFAGKTIIITGANGFLGRYYVAVLEELNREQLSEPCRIVALDNAITSRERSPNEVTSSDCTFIKHDVIEEFEWDEPLAFVIHGAGIASPFYYRAYPLETLAVATTGTKNLLELAHRHNARFLFMSSSEIYGDPDPNHIPTAESYRGNVACLGPRACYDEGKRVGETFCYVYNEIHGLPTVIVRPFNVFGPGMSQADYRILPNFASCLVSGRPVNIYGSGLQTRTYCYVTDAIAGFFKALIKGVPGEPYNIGNPTPEISVPDLVARIGKVLDRTLDSVLTDYPDSYPADEPTRRCPDIKKAQLQLGYEPVVDLDEGLRRFFTWAQDNYTPQR